MRTYVQGGQTVAVLDADDLVSRAMHKQAGWVQDVDLIDTGVLYHYDVVVFEDALGHQKTLKGAIVPDLQGGISGQTGEGPGFIGRLGSSCLQVMGWTGLGIAGLFLGGNVCLYLSTGQVVEALIVLAIGVAMIVWIARRM